MYIECDLSRQACPYSKTSLAPHSLGLPSMAVDIMLHVCTVADAVSVGLNVIWHAANISPRF